MSKNRWSVSPHHQGARPCHWMVYGSSGGGREASMADPVWYQRPWQGLPPGRPAFAFWPVRRRCWRLGSRRRHSSVFFPRRSLAQGSAGREQPLPRANCPYKEAQKESVTFRASLWRGMGGKHSSRSGASKPKTDLQTVLQAKRSSAQPCHVRCSWAQRSPESTLLSSFRLET